MDSNDMNKMSAGLMQFNCAPNHPTYSFDWTTKGAEADKIDIQTAVTFVIPAVIGLQVGDSSKGYQAPFSYDKEVTTLCQGHIDAVTYSYFDSAGSGCTKPTAPPVCSQATTPGDGSVAGDGPHKLDGGVVKNDTGGGPPGDGYIPSGDGWIPASDAGLPPGDGDDDGCCRVSHARSNSVPFLTLLGFALLLVLARRRRK
jgi:hypothetical protein